MTPPGTRDSGPSDDDMAATGGEDGLGALVSVPAAVPGTGPAEPNGLFVGPNEEPDRFELLGVGLRGGEGTVWRARYCGELRNPVLYAVKQLEPPPGAPTGWPTPADERRWQDQRHLLQSVTNPHLVDLHDVFFGPSPHRPATYPLADDGREFVKPYVVMEWIEGGTLADHVAAGSATLADRLGWVADLADAIQSLHSTTHTFGNPMLHRDIKPANCLVHPRRGAVLIDLGTLRSQSDGYDPLGMHSPDFAAPEALQSPRDPRKPASDLYSLGAVAFFCVTGVHPPAPNERDADVLVRTQLAEALRAFGVRRPKSLAEHLTRMLSHEPSARPSRPTVWAREALALAERPKRRQRRGLWTGLAVLSTLLLVPAGMKMYNSLPSHSGEPAEVRAFTPFGRQFSPFDYRIDGRILRIDPPTGDDRYDHLWGLYSPGDACASVVEFDAIVAAAGSSYGYGFAVAPRAVMDADNEPQGASVQYEWQSADINPVPGFYLRPAQLPGGAWEGTTDPTAAPPITRKQHVRVSSVGATIRITVGLTSVSYDLPRVECGGVAIRAWGAPVTLTDVTISRT